MLAMEHRDSRDGNGGAPMTTPGYTPAWNSFQSATQGGGAQEEATESPVVSRADSPGRTRWQGFAGQNTGWNSSVERELRRLATDPPPPPAFSWIPIHAHHNYPGSPKNHQEGWELFILSQNDAHAHRQDRKPPEAQVIWESTQMGFASALQSNCP